jgi:hypothetical protein
MRISTTITVLMAQAAVCRRGSTGAACALPRPDAPEEPVLASGSEEADGPELAGGLEKAAFPPAVAPAPAGVPALGGNPALCAAAVPGVSPGNGKPSVTGAFPGPAGVGGPDGSGAGVRNISGGS